MSLVLLSANQVMAQNPFKDLQNALKELKASSQKESQQQNSGGAPIPTPSASSGGFKLLSGDVFCKRVKENPTSKKLVAEVNKAILAGYRVPLNTLESAQRHPDPKDQVLGEWVINRLPDVRQRARAEFNQVVDQIVTEANRCAFSLRDTEYVVVFAEMNGLGASSVEKLKADMNNIASSNSPETPSKTLDANGNLVDRSAASGSQIDFRDRANRAVSRSDKMYHGVEGNLLSPGSPWDLIVALMLEGSDNAIENAKKDYIAAMPRNVEVAKTQRAEQARVAEEARVQAKQKEDMAVAERKKRVDAIRKDNSTAASCSELAAVLDLMLPPSKYNVLGLPLLRTIIETSIEPTQKLVAYSGMLLEYDKGNLIQSPSGLMQGGIGGGAKLQFSKSTIWYGKDKLAIGSGVVVIGKYIANTKIKMVKGNTVEVPVLDVTCFGG